MRAAAEIADGMLLAAGAETAWHSREVERIAVRIADQLGLSGEARQNVGVTARLHDIGKVALPPTLLQKTTAPNETEWKLIQAHTVIGERILGSVEELRDVAPWVRASHERWDGGGYPDGLSGEQIPEVSRIVFCADAFHAICTDRPYSSGRSVAAALAEIRRCAGTQFEPRVVAALTDVVREDMYGRNRVRRRSHARISMLLVIAVTLGGSIAGGLAAGRDEPSPDPIQSSAPLEAPVAPGLEVKSSSLAPDLVPSAGVAAAFAQSRPEPAGERQDTPAAPREPALEADLPEPQAAPPVDAGSITDTASEIGNRIRPASQPDKGERRPSDDAETREPGPIAGPPTDDGRHIPDLESTKGLTYSIESSVGTAAPVPAPRPRRPAPGKKRR